MVDAAVQPQQTGVDDRGHRAARLRAEFSGPIGSAAFERLFQLLKELLGVDRRPRKGDQPLDGETDSHDQQKEQRVHRPSTVDEKLDHFSS